jgi:hypothetical protein
MTRPIWAVGGLVAAVAFPAALVAGLAASSHSTAKGAGYLAAKGDRAALLVSGPCIRFEIVVSYVSSRFRRRDVPLGAAKGEEKQ